MWTLRLLCLFSGFSALVFEVLWTRQLSSVFGTTSVAMTCVFSAFIVCLSLGALAAARLRLYDARALRLYGAIEAAIGVFGWASTLVMLHADVWLARWIPSASTTLEVACDLAATLLLIGLPTTLMGATLPVLMNGLRRLAPPRAEVTVIYGLNVIGGALGALACGFVLLWSLGVTGTATTASSVNLLVGAGALAVARRIDSAPARAPRADAPGTQALPISRRSPPWLHPTLAFLTGLFALSYELLWGRMAKFYLGDRTLATSTLLFLYLACMAIGSFAVGGLQRRRPSASLAEGLGRFGTMLGVAAAAHLVGVAFLGFALEHPAIQPLLAGFALPRVAVTLVATIVPVTLLGMAFPFLLQTAEQIDRRPAFSVGVLYFVNSLGGALGALFGGFLAPRSLGTLQGFLATSVAMAAVAVACHAAGAGSRRRRLARAAAVVGLLAVAVGPMPRSLVFLGDRETLVAWNEDEYGVQLVSRNEEGHLNVKNNRVYLVYTLGPLVTNFTQETIAYTACLLSQRCEEILNVGTGFGITAGAFTTFEQAKRIVTVELLPFMCEIQPLFGKYNFQYYRDPRVTRLCADGRRVLAASDERFDVIAVNVLDPYIPGSSGLFTTDFWEMAKSRLKPGGVYGQLIWGPDAERLIQGLASVFPRVLRFPGGWEDAFNVVALADDRDPVLSLDRISPAMTRALARFSIRDAAAYFADGVDQAVRMEREAKARPALVLHSDDMPILEYRWARGDQRSRFEEIYRNTSIFDSLQVHP